jgi:hypothetical protein
MEMNNNSTQKDRQKKQNVLRPSIGGGFVFGTSSLGSKGNNFMYWAACEFFKFWAA